MALAIPSSTAHAATGEFAYRLYTGSESPPPYSKLVNPPSGVCISLPPQTNTVVNDTKSTAWVFDNPDCTYAVFGVTLPPKHYFYGGSSYGFQSVRFN